MNTTMRDLARVDLPSSRHPFEIFTLAFSAVIGLPMVFSSGQSPPPSIVAVLPPWAVLAWGAMFSGGALVALIGCLLGHRLEGVLIEQVGLVGVGMGCLIYGVAALTTIGAAALLPVAVIAGFGLACLWRWVQLQRLINAARHEVLHDR